MKNCKNVQYYVFGEGTLGLLGDILTPRRNKEGAGAVFLIDDFFADKNLEGKLPVDREKDEIIFVSTKEEPHAEYVDELTLGIKTKFKNKLPLAVMGIGGGTTMDIAKCVAILLTNPGRAEDYQGWDLVKNPAVYKIGIPTLSGTGSEVSRTAVITSKKVKLGINSDYSMFDQIILDPSFLKTVPKDQFFYTVMDCYIHSVESLFHIDLNEMTRALSQKSIQLLREVFFGEMDYGKAMIASYFGGCAVASANVGGHVCHPLSYGLSLVLGYRHGLANCLVFNQLEEYFPKEVKEFQEIFRRHKIELPKNIMREVTEDQLERMAEATLKNEKPLRSAFGENWQKIFTKEKVKEILRKI